jgi:hypothetical protein
LRQFNNPNRKALHVLRNIGVGKFISLYDALEGMLADFQVD